MKFTTLLVAAAALAAGIMVSKAQVYSQNVVGYANVVTPTAGNFYLITVPFKIGVSNGANEVYPLVGGQPSIPDFSTILIWNGSGYNAYQSDSGSTSLWDDGTGSPIPNAPLLPVGQGFFLQPSSSTTNTFVGAVAVNVGTSNTVTLPTAGNFYLVAPAVPYGGSVTNGNSSTGGPNLYSHDGVTGLPDFSVLLVWTGNGYNAYQSDSGSPSLWDDGTGTAIANAPTISVGQGFFIQPSSSFTWNVGL